MAYEAVVATTMKRERGQFFTPRNVVEAMVEILAPEPGERVLDPACGSGRFLVACLDRFRRLEAEEMGEAGALELRRRRNSRDVLAAGAGYARDCLFGIDVDPELVRAARMNMLINNDGHGNIVEANSLELTPATFGAGEIPRAEELRFGTFDVVLTNPPFGAKIPVDDPGVLGNFDLAHGWERAEDGAWIRGCDFVRRCRPRSSSSNAASSGCATVAGWASCSPTGFSATPTSSPFAHGSLSMHACSRRSICRSRRSCRRSACRRLWSSSRSDRR